MFDNVCEVLICDGVAEYLDPMENLVCHDCAEKMIEDEGYEWDDFSQIM